jgi:hypothetical protein
MEEVFDALSTCAMNPSILLACKAASVACRRSAFLHKYPEREVPYKTYRVHRSGLLNGIGGFTVVVRGGGDLLDLLDFYRHRGKMDSSIEDSALNVSYSIYIPPERGNIVETMRKRPEILKRVSVLRIDAGDLLAYHAGVSKSGIRRVVVRCDASKWEKITKLFAREGIPEGMFFDVHFASWMLEEASREITKRIDTVTCSAAAYFENSGRISKLGCRRVAVEVYTMHQKIDDDTLRRMAGAEIPANVSFASRELGAVFLDKTLGGEFEGALWRMSPLRVAYGAYKRHAVRLLSHKAGRDILVSVDTKEQEREVTGAGVRTSKSINYELNDGCPARCTRHEVLIKLHRSGVSESFSMYVWS